MITRDRVYRAWRSIPDAELEACPLIHRVAAQSSCHGPEEWDCGCVGVPLITHEPEIAELRLAVKCGTDCQLQRRVRLAELQRSGRRWCYWVFPNSWTIRNANRFTVSIVLESEAGHYLTGDATEEEIVTKSDDYQAACIEAFLMNKDRGQNTKTVTTIVASMLGASIGRGDQIL